MQVFLQAGQFGWDYLLVAEDGRDILIQLDYDYCGVASYLGWSPAQVEYKECPHDGTDGTIDCEACGMKAGDFIQSAHEWLDDNLGNCFDDPGYFGEE